MIVQEIRKKKTRKRNWCDRVIFEIFMIGCVFFFFLFCFLFCCYSLRLPVKILLGNLIWVSLFVSYKGNYVACLIAMLQLMDEKHYQKYVAHFPTDQELLVSFNSWKLLSFGITSECMISDRFRMHCFKVLLKENARNICTQRRRVLVWDEGRRTWLRPLSWQNGYMQWYITQFIVWLSLFSPCDWSICGP